MPVQLSDDEYESFRKAYEFLNEAATSATTRRDFEKMAKKLRPDVTTTEEIAMSYAEPVIAEVRASQDKIDAFLTEQRERDERQTLEAADRQRDDAFARLQAGGYTEDGLEKIKHIMVSRKIADPEAAAALFDRQNPKPMEPIGGAWEPDSWDIKSNAVERDVGALFENPEKWADKEVYSILNEMRSEK